MRLKLVADVPGTVFMANCLVPEVWIEVTVTILLAELMTGAQTETLFANCKLFGGLLMLL